ncbi:hypothetical protein IAG06_18485, partial [Acinetobacter baumannii]|nr:hypothetical protein [Acinetobacter baumannii]
MFQASTALFLVRFKLSVKESLCFKEIWLMSPLSSLVTLVRSSIIAETQEQVKAVINETEEKIEAETQELNQNIHNQFAQIKQDILQRLDV